jgi:cytochrome c-type biogenesis protein CcmH
MSRKTTVVAALCVLLACLMALAPIAGAVEPEEKMADPALEARARSLTRDLRCVVCQNQSVDDSDAPLAKDIRVLVRERIDAGETDEQVRAYIVARYGKFVLLSPPLDYDTWLLWIGPLALFAGGAAMAAYFIRRQAAVAPPAVALSPEEEARVSQRLDGSGS